MNQGLLITSIENLISQDHPYRHFQSLLNFDELTKPLNDLENTDVGRHGYGISRGFRMLMLHIISFIDFRSKESIGKSAQQIYQCAAFIFNHIPQLNDSLAESIHTQQGFKIMEKIGKGKHSEFRFFPHPTQRAEPLAEKTIEPFNTLQNRG